MVGNSSKPKNGVGLDGLLCPNALQSALRFAHASDIRAREGIKELLAPNPALPAAGPAQTANEATGDMDRWHHCLDVLVDDFLARKSELARLNKARRDQIEDFLRTHAGPAASLEEALRGKLGSASQEALLLFAHEAAVFHLLQILLVKRWADLGLMDESVLAPSQQTVNWRITAFLRKNSPKGMMGRHDWSFLKQNVFSWYSPSAEAWERVRLLLSPVNLAGESSDFPARILEAMADRSRLSLLGIQRSLFDARSLWRLLLEQKAYDLRLGSAAEWDFSAADSAILVSGLKNGESLNALRELSRAKELHGIWAYTDSDLERYLSEIFILWNSASEIPQINIHPRRHLKDKDAKAAPLFGEKARVPYQAQLAACFPGNGCRELEDSVSFLDQLKENGLLLVASDCFWPTDQSDKAQRLREAALRSTSVRLILDLRQLNGADGEHLPKGICILEKCSSKELRDSSRPHIVRLRGHLSRAQAEQVWAAIIGLMQQESAPGDVIVNSIASASEAVKVESMAAAACQNQLKAAPWVTLSDPHFYELSGRLRRTPNKAFTLGSILRWKKGASLPTQRGVLLRECEGKALLAALGSEPLDDSEEPGFLFVPESSMPEGAQFFSAQVHSAPVQFWFRLEMEQLTQKGARSTKQPERQAEQRLKLMPMVRLFEPGTLLPVTSPSRPFASLDEARSRLSRAFRSFGMAERLDVHQTILALENSIRQNIELCQEFTKHLFPELRIRRWDLPTTLPEIAPTVALEIFGHLDRSSILQHPSVHVTKLRPTHDFKVSNAVLNELQLGGLAELQVFHGMDAILRLSGPSLILRAAQAELQKRFGRPWSECLERLKFPTDIGLVQTQVKEVLRSIQQQLQLTRDCISLMDQTFCCLFGLAANFEDEKARQTIRHHLSPEEGKIVVSFQRPGIVAPIRREGFESPTGFLQ